MAHDRRPPATDRRKRNTEPKPASGETDREEFLVDESGRESFPASDAPGWRGHADEPDVLASEEEPETDEP